MEGVEMARAMQCFGGLVENVELDPDPNTQSKLVEEYNCVNCGAYQYCRRLAETLEEATRDQM